MTQLIILGVYLLLVNIIAFALFAIDKRRAQRQMTRIPESVLLWMARLGGGLGCIVGMYALHHKKRKPKFLFRVPLWIIIWMFIIVIIIALGEGGDIIDEFKTLSPNDGGF